MKQIITIFSFLFLLTGCSNDTESNGSNGSDNEAAAPQSNVTFSLIAQNDLSPDEKNEIPKTYLVIKDGKAWVDFTAKLEVRNKETNYFTETNIDFTKYQIIAVVDQKYMNGGHSIDITSIMEDRNRIVVKVEKLKPGNIASVITQPYHIVKMAKSNKEVVFK
jgi:hypothetical protein